MLFYAYICQHLPVYACICYHLLCFIPITNKQSPSTILHFYFTHYFANTKPIATHNTSKKPPSTPLLKHVLVNNIQFHLSTYFTKIHQITKIIFHFFLLHHTTCTLFIQNTCNSLHNVFAPPELSYNKFHNISLTPLHLTP